jgi:hypothetical protein
MVVETDQTPHIAGEPGVGENKSASRVESEILETPS